MHVEKTRMAAVAIQNIWQLLQMIQGAFYAHRSGDLRSGVSFPVGVAAFTLANDW